jgi:glycine/D-amino acid oxidase-like deaminating enzyme
MRRGSELIGGSYADAELRPYWHDQDRGHAPARPLEGKQEADLLVIGGGLTGLWAALCAVEADPSRAVVLLEAEELAHGASGRNGGFCSASLTHGIANGVARWPEEIGTLERLGRENLRAIEDAVRRHGIDCGFERTGLLRVATARHEVAWVREEAELSRRHGWEAQVLDGESVRARVASPTYLAAAFVRDTAMVDPARLTWGLGAAARELGVRVHERTPVRSLVRDGAGVRGDCEGGTVRARQALVATSAFPPLARTIRRHVVPVYDYVLVSEPLDAAQREAIGWRDREGISDSGNQFHYYRLTADDRILWGGYDAIYHFGNRTGRALEDRPATFDTLARQFFATFPQLEGIRFTHRWAGAIDTCSRFAMMLAPILGGRGLYVGGFTGLGVGASRFGAGAALDVLAGRDTEATRLEMVRTRPIPFPPEPFRWAGIEITRRALARADRNGGRRGPWLRMLDRLGMGFDS